MGALVSLIYAFLTITMMANQNVTGLTLTIFGTGLSNFIGEQMISASPTGNLKLPDGVMSSLKNIDIPLLSRYLLLDEVLFSQNIFTYLSIVIAVIMFIYLKKTKVGLNLRTIGENPAVADAVGISVVKYKYINVLIGGGICGIGGAFCSNGNKRRCLDGKQRERSWLDSCSACYLRCMESCKGYLRSVYFRCIHGAEILLPEKPRLHCS